MGEFHKILALIEDEWSALHPGHFTSGVRATGTQWIRGWVNTRAGLDSVARRKILFSVRESNPNRSARSLVTIIKYFFLS